MTDWRHARTERLRLDAPTREDAAGLFAIHSDPPSSTHFPQGRHDDPVVADRDVEDEVLSYLAAH